MSNVGNIFNFLATIIMIDPINTYGCHSASCLCTAHQLLEAVLYGDNNRLECQTELVWSPQAQVFKHFLPS